MNKLAVVCSGGGTRCAYAAGFLVGLASERKVTPAIIIAASGNAANACYLASNQYPEIERTWKRHLASKKFVRYVRVWRIIDIDYLIDTVFKRLEPLDGPALVESRTEIRIPVLNKHTKSLEYRDPKTGDAYQILRAAKALPVLYGKRVEIDGVPFMDGALTASTHQMIAEAEKLGATHILVIENRAKSKIFNHVKKRLSSQFTASLPEHPLPKAKCFYVSEDPDSWFATTNPKKLAHMFDSGYSRTQKDTRVGQFLGDFLG